ncbi:DUF349 domain-containing protein [Saxibacter everestensis]|uniref:DUF349 domain-containing protein n=1 Tax=Saxibacter everestensis TaxID=2909229 RepID=A0ABY8R064_9MICO|nr:DUF349 domain-containing protein [Brevibacteriaceae bacterium ZFBP1038]
MADNTPPQNAAKPVPKPMPRPTPGPVPSPAAIRPGTPKAPAIGGEDLGKAREFGRVADDNTVFVRTAGGERVVGQYPNASAEEALNYFARKYADLAAQVVLLEQRLAAGAPAHDLRSTVKQLAETLPEAAAVGDLDSLLGRVEAAKARIDELEASQNAAAQDAKAAALAERTALVERAEELAAADPAKVQWKTSSAQMAALFDEWKALQASGPRLARSADAELWGRFRKARSAFDKHRREFFVSLDQRNAEAKKVKQRLVEAAEALQNSTDWAETTHEYRRLMDEWKASPRAGRKDDDALWAKFRGAQDVFFAAREEQNAQLDAEYEKNLEVKEALLERAEALVPVKQLGQAKAELRAIQDEWEEAGKVPRSQMHKVESRLRAVENALSAAEDREWNRSNPEAKARAEGALSQLDDSIAELEANLAKAQDKGDAKAVAAAEEALTARKAWREQVVKAAADFS